MELRRPISTHGRSRVLQPVDFGPDASRRSVLDRAHQGDLEGALGRLKVFDTGPRHTSKRHLLTLLAVMGPGLVVMVADNDAGSLAIFAQAGQDYGLHLVWLLVPLCAVLYLFQEMVARLGAVSGAGHSRLIQERFGSRWATFALGDLLALGVLTVMTEFIGLEFGLGYLGVNRYIAIPAGVVVLLAISASGSFRRWEQCMYGLVAASLVAIPLALLAGLHRAPDHGLLGGHVTPTGTGLLFAAGIVGGTVAPWQLFFHQSSVVDKRITPRWLNYERADTAVGAGLFFIGTLAVLITCAVAFHTVALHGMFVDGGGVARDLHDQVGSWAGTLFAIALIDGSLLGASAVSLASSYAVGDLRGTRHSLHRGWRNARAFYGTYAVTIIAAAAGVLVIHSSLGLITLAVQALSGALFPSAAVFLLLLAKDPEVLGPHVNPRWLNAVTLVVVAAMVALFSLLDLTTAFPHVGAGLFAIVVGGLAVAGFASWPIVARFSASEPTDTSAATATSADRRTWTMPPIDRLAPPTLSREKTIWLIALRIYLIVTATSIIIRLARVLA